MQNDPDLKSLQEHPGFIRLMTMNRPQA